MTLAAREHLIRRVRALPPLPETIGQLQRLCHDPDAGIQDMCRVLGNDPMLTANILKVINSPIYGLSGVVTSIDQAVALLGPPLVRGFALGATLRRALPMDMAPYGCSNRELALRSSLQQALTQRWMAKVAPGDLPLLAPASFIMDLGMVLISAELTARGEAAAFRVALAGSDRVEEVERSFLGLDNREVGAHLFEHWRFEPDMVQAIRWMSNPAHESGTLRTRAAVLAAVSAELGPVSFLGGEPSACREKALGLVRVAGLDAAAFVAAVEETLASSRNLP